MLVPLDNVRTELSFSLDNRDFHVDLSHVELPLSSRPLIPLAELPPLEIQTLVATIPSPAAEVNVTSWHFATADNVPQKLLRIADLRSKPSFNQKSRIRNQKSPPTRIRPPRDVVKLEDRLRQLLQPPLETLLATQELRFPHEPFAYQLDGIAFLYPRHYAVLADEMGLGKTMQAITAVRLLARSGQARRVLLVCPKPLVTNWQREVATWAPELTVTVIQGPQEQRQWQWQTSKSTITLANYETMVRDIEAVRDLQLRYDLVILDEAQRIKNRAGVTSETIRSVARQRSWALTGTPIENSAEDLVGIFEFVAPGTLHSGMKPKTMSSAVSDAILRRTKEKVLTDLPPKMIYDERIDLTPEQWESYQRAEEDGVVHLNELRTELTIQHVFELVLRLKQICNFDPVTGASSKLERLTADLEECTSSGRKAIVFSQWVQTIERLAVELAPFGPLQYHGRIPNSRRDGVLRQFRDDPESNVLLISYGAGSVGLNLQFASYVFLFDRWWNPAVEDQAINRAHRIGATGPVTVTRFLAEGTIEQRIDDILNEKRALFDEVLGRTVGPASLALSRQDILALFAIQAPAGQLRDAA